MLRFVVILACTALVFAGTTLAMAFGQFRVQHQRPPQPAATIDPDIHKIQHVVIITQENRSFDHYFGMYPGADGIPSGVCVPDPRTGGCDPPYADHADSEYGGPHFAKSAVADVDGGKMDGFVAEAEAAQGGTRTAFGVMGYHDGTDLPNYWNLARNYVLQDHFFESVASYSLPSHVAMFSGWSAHCKDVMDPMSCNNKAAVAARTPQNPVPYAWTDLTYLLYAHGVSWACYLDGTVATAWNVLPGFLDVAEDGQLTNVQDLSNFFAAAQNGTLPAVSWILPTSADSEHPTALVSQGQAYVTSLIDAIMASPNWSSTAIFLWWDDWGGFYDHVPPPTIDGVRLGLRVPALLISPYAKNGYIDSQILSSDSYLKFVEDDFLNGQRLDPATDGRPDSRPAVREAASGYGDLVNDFDFTRSPRAARLLARHPVTTLRAERRVPNGVHSPR